MENYCCSCSRKNYCKQLLGQRWCAVKLFNKNFIMFCKHDLISLFNKLLYWHVLIITIFSFCRSEYFTISHFFRTIGQYFRSEKVGKYFLEMIFHWSGEDTISSYFLLYKIIVAMSSFFRRGTENDSAKSCHRIFLFCMQLRSKNLIF